MRLPMTEDKQVDREKAIPMIHRAFEAGVNYIDSAVGYCNNDSQRALGDAYRAIRLMRRASVFYSKKLRLGPRFRHHVVRVTSPDALHHLLDEYASDR